MKMILRPTQSPLLLVLAVVLAVFGAQNLPAAQDGGPPQAGEQKLGVRIINFFKDVVYGEKPDNRYRGYGPQSRPQYRAEPERRYSLDEPPMEPGPTYAPNMPAPSRPVAPAPAPKPKSQPLKSESETPRREPKPEAQQKAPEPKPKPPVVQDRLPEEKPATKPSPPKKEKEAPPQVVENKAPAPSSPEPPRQSFMGPAATGPSPTPTDIPSPPAATSSPQVGSKTSTPGRVKSPYPPFNELDVTGLTSGSLAMDPTTQKVFRVP